MNKTIILDVEQQAELTKILTTAIDGVRKDAIGAEEEARRGRKSQDQRNMFCRHADALRNKASALNRILNQL